MIYPEFSEVLLRFADQSTAVSDSRFHEVRVALRSLCAGARHAPPRTRRASARARHTHFLLLPLVHASELTAVCRQVLKKFLEALFPDVAPNSTGSHVERISPVSDVGGRKSVER